MAKNKMKEKVIDTEPIKDDREEVAEAAQEMVEEQTGDKVTDQAAEEDDKSARMAAAESEWQDKYRKRTLREKMDLIASGGEDVIKSLLTVMDDIDRALDAMSKSSDIDSIRQGIVLIHQKLLETLHAKGVEEITAIGKELDTDLHEAVAKFPVSDEKKGKIIDVVQKGYKLKDKVVRFAKVVVGE